MNDGYDDYRDLTTPRNFINRTPDEQKRACLYFLRAGAIESFHTRIRHMRDAHPAYVVDLSGADLPKSSLWQVNLSAANLRFAIFDWSNLEQADLSGADLTGASLLGVSFYGADLRGANLSGADLRGADLTDARLDGAILDGVQEGEVPADRLRERPAYRERRQTPQPKKNQGARVAPLGGDLSSHGALARREYHSSVKARSGDKRPAEDAEDVMEAQIRKREEKKAEQKKWYENKRAKEKFIAKKNYEQQKMLDRKRQDDLAFQRKKKEQEDFLARKRREEETRRH